MEFELKSSVMKVVEGVYKDVTREVVEKLASHFKFDVEEAMSLMRVSLVEPVKKVRGKGRSGESVSTKTSKKAKEQPSMPLPFCGVVCEDQCYGIRLNHGLHTQCQNMKEGLGEYCKTCQKHADKNASGKPNHGDIRDRLECGLLEYRDPKGRKTLPYANVVKTLGLDREVCEREAEKFGLTIPEEHWEVKEKKRGRPKKSVTEVSDTSSEKSTKKRGRPRKVKKVVSEVGDDLLSALRSAASDGEEVESVKTTETSESTKEKKEEEENAAKKAKEEEKKRKAKERAAAKAAKKAKEEAEKKAKEEAEKAAKEAAKEAEEEEEEEELEAKLFEFEGKRYLITSENVLYPEDAMESDDAEPVGLWNEELQKIVEVDVMSDDDESCDDE